MRSMLPINTRVLPIHRAISRSAPSSCTTVLFCVSPTLLYYRLSITFTMALFRHSPHSQNPRGCFFMHWSCRMARHMFASLGFEQLIFFVFWPLRMAHHSIYFAPIGSKSRHCSSRWYDVSHAPKVPDEILTVARVVDLYRRRFSDECHLARPSVSTSCASCTGNAHSYTVVLHLTCCIFCFTPTPNCRLKLACEQL